jgi:putative tryptophan/tyrosine transport system substrate-binding protein
VKRRQFITLLGGAAAAWPVVARAQQPDRMPLIGFLGSSTPTSQSAWVAAFTRRLRELGWIEGRTMAIEYRWAEGRSDRFAEIAAEFVRLKVDVIVTTGGAAYAAKQATSVIPIVFAVANDPVGSGLVAGLARPGGNVTGLSIQAPDLAGKRLELLRAVVHRLDRLAIMGNAGNPSVLLEMREVQGTARTLGFEVATLEIRSAEDIVPAFETLKGGADALYVCFDPVLSANRIRINTLASAARLPTIASVRELVEAGSLMSYGPSLPDQFRRAADYVDKILRGTTGDLPVEQPTKFRFHHKPYNRQGARPRNPTDAARPRRRGDRVGCNFAALLCRFLAHRVESAARPRCPELGISGLTPDPRFHLATRPLLVQHQGSTAILADDVKRILTDIDADHGDFAVEFLGHWRAPLSSVPFASLAHWQGWSTAEPSHSGTFGRQICCDAQSGSF